MRSKPKDTTEKGAPKLSMKQLAALLKPVADKDGWLTLIAGNREETRFERHGRARPAPSTGAPQWIPAYKQGTAECIVLGQVLGASAGAGAAATSQLSPPRPGRRAGKDRPVLSPDRRQQPQRRMRISASPVRTKGDA